MYMVSYCGVKSRTFDVWDTIQEAKNEAEKHAVKNNRTKGYYRICCGDVSCGDLFCTNLKTKTIKGIKHGRHIEWEE